MAEHVRRCDAMAFDEWASVAVTALGGCTDPLACYDAGAMTWACVVEDWRLAVVR